MGRVIDRFGARFALVLSNLCACASYATTGVAVDVRALFLSQIFSLGTHAMHASQTLTSLVSSPEERAGSLGRLSLSYGVGMVVGPSLGGLIAKHATNRAALLVSACVSLAAAALVQLALPDVKGQAAASGGGDASSRMRLVDVLQLLATDTVRLLVLVKVFCGTAAAVFRTTVGLAVQYEFKLEPEWNGYLMSGVGVLGVVVNAFVVGALTRRFADRVIVQRCAQAMLAAFMVMAAAPPSLTAVAVLTAALTVSGTVLLMVVTSWLTKSVPAEHVGVTLGLDMAAGAFSRVISPAMAAALFQRAGASSVGILGAVLCLLAVLLASGLPTSGSVSASPARRK
jgi:predicted MFS family arabinose efflux permease